MPLLDRLCARDVGLRRLHTALVATLTTLATLLALLGLAAALGRSASFAVPGVLVTAIATMGIGMDPDVGHRTRTTLLMAGPGVAGLVLGALCQGHPVATALVFMGLGVATLVGSFAGSRGILLGLAAIGVFYGAGLAAVPLDDVAVHAIAVVVGALLSAVLLGPVLGQRPARQPTLVLRSVRACAVQVQDAATGADRDRTRRALDRLAGAVSIARSHVEAHPGHWPAALRPHGGAALGTFALRVEQEASRVLAGGDDAGLRSAVLEAPDAGPPSPSSPSSSLSSPCPPAPAPSSSLPLSAAAGGRSQVSMAVQLLVASAAALTVSMLIDPDRWFWGVLAALVMLFGTSSAAEAIGKGGRRVLGTALALPVGAAVVSLTHHWLPLVVALMVVALFCQQYLADVAYGWSIFFLTLFMYLMFALSTPGAGDVLAVRLLQTAVGAAVGVTVAMLVLPTRSGRLLAGRAVDVLDAADALVGRVVQEVLVQDVMAAVREVTHRFQQLGTDAEASRRGWPFSPAHRVVRGQLDAAAVVVRELQVLADDYAAGRRPTAVAASSAARVRRSLAGLRSLVGGAGARPVATSSADAPTDTREAAEPPVGADGAVADPTAGTLHRLQLAVDGMQQLFPEQR